MYNYMLMLIIFFIGAASLIMGLQNPVHSILTLMLVFVFGTLLLFALEVEYFAILFMIVYVGAIVVLFLFIVMMLEIKMTNTSEKFRDFFSFRNLVIALFLIEILVLGSVDFFDITSNLISQNSSSSLKESNLYIDYSHLLQYTDTLRVVGGVLFTTYNSSLLIAATLLFLAMLGAIVMTLESSEIIVIKTQDANQQAIRHPSLLGLSYSNHK